MGISLFYIFPNGWQVYTPPLLYQDNINLHVGQKSEATIDDSRLQEWCMGAR